MILIIEFVLLVLAVWAVMAGIVRRKDERPHRNKSICQIRTSRRFRIPAAGVGEAYACITNESDSIAELLLTVPAPTSDDQEAKEDEK